MQNIGKIKYNDSLPKRDLTSTMTTTTSTNTTSTILLPTTAPVVNYTIAYFQEYVKKTKDLIENLALTFINQNNGTQIDTVLKLNNFDIYMQAIDINFNFTSFFTSRKSNYLGYFDPYDCLVGTNDLKIFTLK